MFTVYCIMYVSIRMCDFLLHSNFSEWYSYFGESVLCARLWMFMSTMNIEFNFWMPYDVSPKKLLRQSLEWWIFIFLVKNNNINNNRLHHKSIKVAPSLVRLIEILLFSLSVYLFFFSVMSREKKTNLLSLPSEWMAVVVQYRLERFSVLIYCINTSVKSLSIWRFDGSKFHLPYNNQSIANPFQLLTIILNWLMEW